MSPAAQRPAPPRTAGPAATSPAASSKAPPAATRRPNRGRVATALAVAGCSLAVVVTGCGHPATPEECNAIIAKSAELELRAQNVTDPAVIAQRIEAVKAARGEDLLKRCVGKRITERALACVGRAQSPVEVDKCLD